MKLVSKARADWRASTCAALIGSGLGLALGAAYMAGGMARTATDHARASRIADAAAGGFSEDVLQRQAEAMSPGMLKLAARHDSFIGAETAQRDRQNSIIAAYQDRPAGSPAQLIRLNAAPAQSSSTRGALNGSRELECLTQAVYYEARGETPAGQAAVAQVVLNRVRNPAFPKSVCAVVFQGAGKRVGCQFSFACDGSMRRGREPAAWARAGRVASRALAGKVVPGVGAATHFHTVNVAPNWGPRLIRTAEVGMHVFYRPGRAAPSVAPKAEDRVVYASLTAAPPPQNIQISQTLQAAVLKTAPLKVEASKAAKETPKLVQPVQSVELKTPPTVALVGVN
ncbi:cell wall hydrolase [Phenylobacterium koreense]|uniref:Spore germination cell wall hydrolase CwlJ-like protein n=1 Tax=Phenylobacterium koreense TaxID=266125 RepID=A0ABV2EE70_9CAUL